MVSFSVTYNNIWNDNSQLMIQVEHFKAVVTENVNQGLLLLALVKVTLIVRSKHSIKTRPFRSVLFSLFGISFISTELGIRSTIA